MKKNDYAVYSLKMANELVSRGFVVVNTSINLKYPKYQVFYFEDTRELREAMKQIANK